MVHSGTGTSYVSGSVGFISLVDDLTLWGNCGGGLDVDGEKVAR
ncbi:hypothetical protein Jden_1828 [Jonesia denitrificans DSM 20603]|uniref:Uncharacterized protein n=1 Tax=Jonesia denitrificans (strain ATCC 14870 / DSM 20603 / BCRC 15368 / CIP 55.134 / JCM 11481 / NBRC 15587 / NCTC 10816 / Prevot 55134) TaxID=471856 RepID=C7QZH3_JONDD|nr:hypothetical protein Jden_1828 [Jonesia denitrificans DSM 20603]